MQYEEDNATTNLECLTASSDISLSESLNTNEKREENSNNILNLLWNMLVNSRWP